MSKDSISLCLASYGDQAAAEAGWAALRDADKRGELKLRDGGVVAADEKGHLDVVANHHHATRKGALIGGVLALATPVGLLVGVLGGAAAGKISKKLKHQLSKDQLRDLGQFLERGDVLVVGLIDGESEVDLEKLLDGANEVVTEVVTEQRAESDMTWLDDRS